MERNLLEKIAEVKLFWQTYRRDLSAIHQDEILDAVELLAKVYNELSLKKK